jgi:hypothetical protein
MKLDSKLTIATLMLFIIIASSILTFSLPVLIMQFIMATITIPLIVKKDYKTAKLYFVIFIVSLSFVFIVYLANQYFYGSPYYIGGSDDLKFEEWGRDVYHANLLNPSKILESGLIGRHHNSPFFVVYISLLIRFANFWGGYSTFLPRIMNVYFLIWICIIFESLLKKYTNFTDNKIYFTIALFALMPNTQYINAHIFRDTFNLFQIFFIAYLFDKLMSKKIDINTIIYLLTLAALIFITFYTRKNALAFAGALILFMSVKKINLRRNYFLIPLFCLPIVMLTNLTQAIRLDYFIETYSNYVLNIAGDGLSRFVFQQPLIPFGALFRAMYALVSPFPNFFSLFKEPNSFLYDIVMLLIYMGVVIQVLAIPFILKRAFKLDWLALSFLAWFLATIATTFTFRHMIFYYPFMVALGVDGYISLNKKTRVKTLFLISLAGLSLSLIYASLKVFT